MKRFLFLVFIAAPLAAQIPTQPPRESAMPETISVNGTGHATLTPDRFSFTAGVQMTAPTVEEAVNQNNSKMTAVIAALKRAGASDQEVRTSNFSIFPQQVYEQGKPPRITGYQANNSVTVTKSGVAGTSRRPLPWPRDHDQRSRIHYAAASSDAGWSHGCQSRSGHRSAGLDRFARVKLRDFSRLRNALKPLDPAPPLHLK